MSLRILRLVGACSLLAAFGAPACGGSASDSHSSAGSPGNGGGAAHAGSGSGGNGTIGRAGAAAAGAPPAPVACGSKSCSGLVLPVLDLPVSGCCAERATNQCGLDSSVLEMLGGPTFDESCQPLAQPGTADTTCPDSPSAPVANLGISISFPGCCRANHTCGYQFDTIGGAFRLGLGCVDSAPFLDGDTPQACGESGAAGAGGDSGGSGAGGG
ncbi:MAG TPA: hypothetical protein VER12_08635 [Polyangiaceae bacterium]|nr:hypothetical protein [Polyangiaceae bacterium]